MVGQPNHCKPIPVIDLFAGPGGLGEGFSSVLDGDGNRVFKIALSVEMDEHAHRTLELRAFYRQFNDDSRPSEYYEYLMNPSPDARAMLFKRYAKESSASRSEAWRHELRPQTAHLVAKRAREALEGAKDWVLIGGPPCQAYSLVGRARRKNDKHFANDERHVLYRRYLKLIQDLEPPVFVMENVKGMLSAKLGEHSTIEKVLDDLRAAGPGYDIYSFVTPTEDPSELRPADFVIRAEQFGVPQCRHRVILLGVRKAPEADRGRRTRISSLNPRQRQISAAEAISDMPRLRSKISKRACESDDTAERWLEVMTASLDEMTGASPRVLAAAKRAVAKAKAHTPPDTVKPDGARRSRKKPVHDEWYLRDTRAARYLNHNSRSHMASDLARYLFCASFANINKRSPKLADMPIGLLPSHRNVAKGVSESHFGDRFRVQRSGEPSSTITSHISKDGHYYIHYDPSQCRSLSVREAARLQTFPDDYFFEGNVTQQYHQVGNAVPPLLAVQLGEVVAQVFGRSVSSVS